MEGVTDGDLTVICAKDARAVLNAEQELQRFMQTLTDTFAHLPIGAYAISRSGVVLAVNRAFCEITGLTVNRPSMFVTATAFSMNTSGLPVSGFVAASGSAEIT